MFFKKLYFGTTQHTRLLSEIKLCAIFHNFVINIQLFWTTVTFYEFVIFFIAGSYTQVQWYQNAIKIISLVKKELYELKIPIYVSYPVLGQWLKFSQCPCLLSRLFSLFCTYMIFWPVIKCIEIPTFTCT